MTSFDPNHWKCTPEFIPPIHPPARNPKNKYEGRCNTSTKTLKVAQNFYGILHPHVLTGYKMPRAYGQTPVFEDLTTKQHFENQVRKVGEEAGPSDKRLVPYHPNATRNRPKSETLTDVGLMNFDRRNASYFRYHEEGSSKESNESVGWKRVGVGGGCDSISLYNHQTYNSSLE